MKIDKVKQIALKKYGKALTDEQAAQYGEKFGKLTNDELDSVSGGCGPDSDKPCPNCGSDERFYLGQPGGRAEYRCKECMTVYQV